MHNCVDAAAKAIAAAGAAKHITCNSCYKSAGVKRLFLCNLSQPLLSMLVVTWPLSCVLTRVVLYVRGSALVLPSSNKAISALVAPLPMCQRNGQSFQLLGCVYILLDMWRPKPFALQYTKLRTVLGVLVACVAPRTGRRVSAVQPS